MSADSDPATSPRRPGGSSRAGDRPGVGGVLGALGAAATPPSGESTGRDDVTVAAARALREQVTGWFEPLYADAEGAASRIPWASLAPHPHLVSWLDQPGLDVRGVDAVVVGCGLGDDAAELARRGCRVTAFDVSPTAVAWARRRFPDADVRWLTADLLDLPDELVGGFGLVVEVRTAQSLPASVRDAAMLATASLVAPGGYLVASTLMATSDEAARRWEGPPWALAPAELAAHAAGGLERLALEHPPAPGRDAMQVRLTFHRPT